MEKIKQVFRPLTHFFQLAGHIHKRKRFIIATFLMSCTFVVSTFLTFDVIVFYIPLVVLAVYAAVYFAILRGISGMEKLTLFIPPVYFSVAFYLFYFFLPQRWLTRLPFIVLYSVVMYAMLLSQNIFNVGASKSIQLFRAAFSVNYLLLTMCCFVMSSLLVSLRLHPVIMCIMCGVLVFPLTLHVLWSVTPKDVIEKSVLAYAGVTSVIIAEVAAVLAFVPVNQSIYALMLTSVFYSVTGLVAIDLQGMLFKDRVREYILVMLFTLVLFFMSINW